MAQEMAQPRATRRKWLLPAAAILALIVLWIALRALWSGRIEPGLLQPRVDQLPNAPLGEVLMQQLPVRYELIGSVQSRVPMMAASRVAARVVEIKVRAGDRVRTGQLIIRLDASDLNAQTAQAQAELAAAQAELARAAADHKRFSALFARGSVTASERDTAQAAWRGATAKVAQAQAAVAAARAGSEYATVRSPVDGIVVERLVEPGDMAMPGKPLVRLYDENALRVELMVPEELARQIGAATPLEVRVGATGGVYRTLVSEIVPAADPASRSFVVRAPLPRGQHLQPGMFARATFSAGSQATLTLPRAAVKDVGQLHTVRVVNGRMIQTRMVSLGRSFGDRIEVLAGLYPGERVVLDGRETADR